MADNIEHQDKGELVANCDRFNSLKHSTVRSNVHYVGSIKDPNGGYGYPMIKDYSDFLKGQQKLKNLKSASNLNGNLNCSKELEHYAS